MVTATLPCIAVSISGAVRKTRGGTSGEGGPALLSAHKQCRAIRAAAATGPVPPTTGRRLLQPPSDRIDPCHPFDTGRWRCQAVGNHHSGNGDVVQLELGGPVMKAAQPSPQFRDAMCFTGARSIFDRLSNSRLLICIRAVPTVVLCKVSLHGLFRSHAKRGLRGISGRCRLVVL